MFFQCVFLSVLLFIFLTTEGSSRWFVRVSSSAFVIFLCFYSPYLCSFFFFGLFFFLFFHVSRKKGRCKSKLLHRSNTTSVVVLPVARPQPLLYSPSIVRIKKDDNVSQLRIGISGYGTNTPTYTHTHRP